MTCSLRLVRSQCGGVDRGRGRYGAWAVGAGAGPSLGCGGRSGLGAGVGWWRGQTCCCWREGCRWRAGCLGRAAGAVGGETRGQGGRGPAQRSPTRTLGEAAEGNLWARRVGGGPSHRRSGRWNTNPRAHTGGRSLVPAPGRILLRPHFPATPHRRLSLHQAHFGFPHPGDDLLWRVPSRHQTGLLPRPTPKHRARTRCRGRST